MAKQELPSVDFPKLEQLAKEIQEYLPSIGVLLPVEKDEKAADTLAKNGDSDAVMSKPLENFIIAKGKEAFYTQINSKDDVDKWNQTVEKSLTHIHENLKKLLDTNTDSLNDSVTKQAKRFGSSITKTKRALHQRAKSITVNCDSIEEMRNKARDVYTKLLREKIVDTLLIPIYEGCTSNDANERVIYGNVLKQINQLLAELGVFTIPIKVDEIMNYDFYVPKEPENEDITSDPDLKDKVKRVDTYAYAFYEGEEAWPISTGSVVVWRYKK